ncbi:hypothetical protein [Salinarimonas ramus]|uniref:Uncharacterized protein n=1 Tax=Salinarimonas ramus TaxID=690164 RepID=A0A917Q4J3_9HYPH|nr:hypothetical protein [Salinarimonas ramus]GGK24395.1 hypothetical protein GCM10011322_08780 [Salinarimonas ramus]
MSVDQHIGRLAGPPSSTDTPYVAAPPTVPSPEVSRILAEIASLMPLLAQSAPAEGGAPVQDPVLRSRLQVTTGELQALREDEPLDAADNERVRQLEQLIASLQAAMSAQMTESATNATGSVISSGQGGEAEWAAAQLEWLNAMLAAAQPPSVAPTRG